MRGTDGTYQEQFDSTGAQKVSCTNCTGPIVQVAGGLRTAVLGLRLYGALNQPLGDINPIKTFSVSPVDP